MNSFQPIPKFIPSAAGKIFTLTFACQNPHSRLLFIPPFAEEANKSRHILAALGRRHSQHGIQTTIVDLYGCGDSEGDLDQASLDIWNEDIANAINHIQCENSSELIIGGLRLGATIAANFAANFKHRQPLKQLLLWQPIPDGTAYMKQFLRLKVAESLTSRKEGPTTSEIIESIQQGNTQEISGYPLTKELFEHINNLRLSEMDIEVTAKLFEVNTEGSASIPFTKLSEKLNNAQLITCKGPQFWACQEIAQCDSLLDATQEALLNKSPGGSYA